MKHEKGCDCLECLDAQDAKKAETALKMKTGMAWTKVETCPLCECETIFMSGDVKGVLCEGTFYLEVTCPACQENYTLCFNLDRVHTF